MTDGVKRAEFLSEAKRLWDLGWAIHWLRPGSKAPVEGGWSAPKRDGWPELERKYRPGYGLGVKMGRASKVAGGFLANIDLDIKSEEDRHKKEAFDFLKKKFPDLAGKPVPSVVTGYGRRYFVVTAEPVQGGKLGASGEEVKVRMPTAPVNRRQENAVKQGLLTAAELKAGWRMRPAWEIEFMSEGRQVVLPPTVHPDTGRAYRWSPSEIATAVDRLAALPVVSTEGMELARARGRPHGSTVVQNFEPVAVDLVNSGLPDAVITAIVDGDPNEPDRSASAFTVCRALIRARMSEIEALSVLTDKDYFLGQIGYDRRGPNRAAAAAWVRDYCWRPAQKSVSAKAAFETEVGVSPVKKDGEESEAEDNAHWSTRLQRTGKGGSGPPKAGFGNILLVLENECPKDFIKKDLFAWRRVFGAKSPWGGDVGTELKSVHLILLREWFTKHWQMDVHTKDLDHALEAIAARNEFHPIRDYLDGLHWDGVPRIDTWLERYLNMNNGSALYRREVSRKFLIGMVQRIYEPGCKVDTVLVLAGKQGIKKSTALSVLAGGDKYFTSTVLEPNQKDSILKMQSKWIMEFGEMSNAKSDVRALKNFISMPVDRDRMPFQPLAEDFPRQCVFTGSTNEDEIIFDQTGTRRWWVAAVTDIDTDALARDRDQLLAEAAFAYQVLGDICYLGGEAEKDAAEEAANWSQHEDVMVETIEKILERNSQKHLVYKKEYLVDPKNAAMDTDLFPEEGFSLAELAKLIEIRVDHQVQRRICSALRILGFAPKNVKRGKRTVKLWFSKSPMETEW